jgi:hypothetical protein
MLLPAAAGVLAAVLAAAPAATQSLALSQPRPLSIGQPALPRIAAPVTPAAAKINAALDRMDRRWVAFAHGCHDDESAPSSDAAGRSVEVTARGPAYLSLVIRYDYSCGGAHPDGGTIALVYDLETGRPVDWLKLLPAGLKARADLDTAGEGSSIGRVSSPALHALYLQAVKADKAADQADCADVLADPALPFQLWPDARAHGLVLEPAGLPHAVAACANTEAVPSATLRRLGLDGRMLEAIDEH